MQQGAQPVLHIFGAADRGENSEGDQLRLKDAPALGSVTREGQAALSTNAQENEPPLCVCL